jgi:putative SbcD/Mre11-related phosphoesterase
MESKTKIKYIGKCLLIEFGEGLKTEKVLVVGDLHLGYEELLNKSGVFVSRQMFDEMISDFNAIFGEVGHVNKIILLGDIKHDFGTILTQEWEDVTRIINYLKPLSDEMIIIRGNHDTILEPIVKRLKIKLRDYYFWKEFCFTHGDEDFDKIWGKRVEWLIVGHGHPAIKLREGSKMEKYKCFLVGKFKGKKMIVVPSFIEYYVGSDPREGEVILVWDINFNNFDVKIVSDNLEVLDFGKLKKIKNR